VRHKLSAILRFEKVAPYSASVADETTTLIMELRHVNAPLIMASSSLLPR
jgi:hypothetical protein